MKIPAIALAALAGALTAAPASAAPAAASTDTAFRQCLVAQTTRADRVTLIRWIFAVVSSTPEVQDMANVSPERRAALNHDAGALLSRLMTRNCRSETVAALRNGGVNGLKSGFTALSSVAINETMARPAVLANMPALFSGIDMGEFTKLMMDSGVDPMKLLAQ